MKRTLGFLGRLSSIELFWVEQEKIVQRMEIDKKYLIGFICLVLKLFVKKERKNRPK